MVDSEKRGILSIVMVVLFAAAMLFTAGPAFAAGGDGTSTDELYTLINSDGQAVENAYVSGDGFVYRIKDLNADYDLEEGETPPAPEWVAEVYGDLNASSKTEIKVPETLGGYPVYSVAMDPRNPVEKESYNEIQTLSLPKTVEEHHYFRFFTGLKEVTVDPENSYYKNRSDGVKDGVLYYQDRDEGDLICGVEFYPRGKTETSWVMPEELTQMYRFYEGCTLEEITIPKNVSSISPRDLLGLKNLKAVNVSEENENYYSDDGVLFYKENDEDDEGDPITITCLGAYPAAKEGTQYTVPEGTNCIEWGSFSNAKTLEKLILATTIKKIYCTFDGCEKLKAIEFTAQNAPDPEDYDQYEELQEAMKEHNLEILYPETGKGYEGFVFWLKTNGLAPIPENPEEIVLDKAQTVRIKKEGEVVTFAFTPAADGEYCFESQGDYDSKGCVLTENEPIGENDDGGQGSNFKVCFTGKAGVTYYLQAVLWDDETGTFSVLLTEDSAEEHEWSSPSYKWADDYSKVTATRSCDECDKEQTETAQTTSAVIKEASCTEPGKTRYTAEFKNTAFETQTKEIENIPMKPHSIVAVEEKEATYTEPGNSAYWYCSQCKKYFGDAEGKNEIEEGSWVKDMLTPTVGESIPVAGGATVVVLNMDKATVGYASAPNKASVIIPNTYKIGGKTFKVTTIKANAFKGKKAKAVTAGKFISKMEPKAFNGSKVKTLTVKTKLLTKKSVKGAFKGSKVKTVKVQVGKKSMNKKFVKKYKKIFTKKNAGRKATVK